MALHNEKWRIKILRIWDWRRKTGHTASGGN